MIGRRPRRTIDIWPGFVDALATLLMVIIFVLLVFALSQFFMGRALSGREQILERLNAQVAQLGQMLNIERNANEDLRRTVAQLSSQLQSSQLAREQLSVQMNESTDTRQDNTKLGNEVAALQALRAELEARVRELGAALGEREGALAAERNISEEARAQIALMNQQMAQLRTELARLNQALDASDALSKEQRVQIQALGQRLNQALASKVEELSRYRSEFFGRLRQVLGNRPGIRVEGDRFVFQSELLFPSGSDALSTEGERQLAELAKTLRDISGQLPTDINWVLRVDGHTDRRPIATARFPSNWELSAARAISVVKFLNSQAIPSERLAATGFGEFQPIDRGDSEPALARNRRIEIRFDQR
jgi:chemotaxis protein MotB